MDGLEHRRRDAIVLLARPEGAPEGAAGIGLYLVPRLLEDGTPTGIHMRRLKNKLGTRSVPTGEVVLEDALGYAMRGKKPEGANVKTSAGSSDAKGLNRMMEMVNGTRLGVSMMALGIARRSFMEAAIWAHHREVKGRVLVDLPLVRTQLVDLAVDLQGSMLLGFCGAVVDMKTPEGRLMRRLTTPAAKARLSRFGVGAATFAMELHGGNGYCEDWGLTRQLRDALCNPIWEGTENICHLDTLRVIRDEEALEVVTGRIETALEAARGGYAFITPSIDIVDAANTTLRELVAGVQGIDTESAQIASLRISEMLASTLAAALLLEDAEDDARKALMAVRYTDRHLTPNGKWNGAIAMKHGRDIIASAEIELAEVGSLT